MSRARYEENLQRLLGSFEIGAPNEDDIIQLRCAKVAQQVPLAHSTSAGNFADVCESGRLLSPEKLDGLGIKPLKVDAVERILETSGSVFLYAAPFSFPSSGCGLLFARTLESAHTDNGAATPFDSGALVNFYTRPDMSESPLDYLRRHELPLPEHRNYLQACVGTLFAAPFDYVNGDAPARQGPIELSGGDCRRWTHEVRIPNEVLLRSPHLKAVFVPRRLGLEPQVKSLLSWCDSEGFDVEVFDSDRENDFAKLRAACLEYVHKLLN